MFKITVYNEVQFLCKIYKFIPSYFEMAGMMKMHERIHLRVSIHIHTLKRFQNNLDLLHTYIENDPPYEISLQLSRSHA